MKTFDDFKRFNQLVGDRKKLKGYFVTWDVIWDALIDGDLQLEDYGIPYTKIECEQVIFNIACELDHLDVQIHELESKWEND